MTDEPQQIQRMLAGDQRAFDAFFDAYFPRIYRFALPRLNGDVEAARDVVQATLIKAIQNLDRYRGESALFTWVCQICRHQIVDFLRVHRRTAQRVVSIDDHPEFRAAIESIAAPDEYDLLKEQSRSDVGRLIQTVLDRLPTRYGDALEWKYLDGDSVEDIGERLGIGHAAAQSLLARARVAFKEALETVFGAAAADILTGIEAGS